jgi:hypothetical protein
LCTLKPETNQVVTTILKNLTDPHSVHKQGHCLTLSETE